jgi:hypothetical protein
LTQLLHFGYIVTKLFTVFATKGSYVHRKAEVWT